jgi:hypothetical protein
MQIGVEGIENLFMVMVLEKKKTFKTQKFKKTNTFLFLFTQELALQIPFWNYPKTI